MLGWNWVVGGDCSYGHCEGSCWGDGKMRKVGENEQVKVNSA